eukprot:6650652-Prymnesium_polylepis.1
MRRVARRPVLVQQAKVADDRRGQGQHRKEDPVVPPVERPAFGELDDKAQAEHEGVQQQDAP